MDEGDQAPGSGMTHLAIVVTTNGRQDLIEQTWQSASVHLLPQAGIGGFGDPSIIIVDDSGDPVYAAWLDNRLSADLIIHHLTNEGLASAVRDGWNAAAELGADYLFHLEDDFTFDYPAPLGDMALMLRRHPELAEVVLQRQPWNNEEKAQGDIFGEDPRYVAHFEQAGVATFYWRVEQSHIFSLNPCLVPRVIIDLGWPDGAAGEAEMTQRVVQKGYRMAFWGRKGQQMVTHIGGYRAASWRV